MALSNYERVGKALESLKNGLGPFIDREVTVRLPNMLDNPIKRIQASDHIAAGRPVIQWDVSLLLGLMWDSWNDVFRTTLGPAERNLVGELRGFRNRWAHQETFSSDDAYRMLDSTHRLLSAISAQEAEDVDRMKKELLRIVYEEQSRSERRKTSSLFPEVMSGSLKPWREIVTPHPDVASGRFQEAEFAADLWQVYLGQGSDEYLNPVEFFNRTYLTGSLKKLLVGAIRRLSGQASDPVIQLQTNFGGGKTHSMLALYHLFSGISPLELSGLEPVLKEAGVTDMPSVRRVVLVGNKLSPGNPQEKDDGTLVRTIWGELAWQLGGKKAYERIRLDDERATSPGDLLRELFIEYGPCLVLVDEWVSYARQLHDTADLPAGTFDTQFSFAQALTESAKLAGNCLVVVSLPASDTSGSPHTQVEEVEVGGIRGREALDRLRNVVGRVESSWRPATAEEGFEIVKRRLFEPLADQTSFRDRDVVARAFCEMYRNQHQEFPPECREADYETRLRDAYPIHPEIFDRLYTDWSTLVKFQRTRGVLRLMAMVIHCLWKDNDRSPLILPATIDMDDPRVKSELLRYLSDSWAPVIERDIDGPRSFPQRLDSEIASLGKYSATRRVARTIYLGSAPLMDAAHKGIEDRRIKLGCAIPGEPVAVFGDALRRLSSQATHLYQEGNRYWYSLQPTVTKIASDRADFLTRNPDKVLLELDRRMRLDTANRGDFPRIHVFPRSGQEVSDDMRAKLVVLSPEQSYGKEEKSPAELAAKAIFESRGTTPRIYRNTLVFLAPDRNRMQDLDEALRRFLAWDSIIADKITLDLTANQVKQAESQRQTANDTVDARMSETYQWLIIPTQREASDVISFDFVRISGLGQEYLAVRAFRKLKASENLLTNLGASILRMDLDRVPLWRGDSVSVAQLAEDYAKYVYLPRLQTPLVLLKAINDGTGYLTWERDSFAIADAWDDDAKRYRGLRGGQRTELMDESSSLLLVKPLVASTQLESEVAGRQQKAMFESSQSGQTHGANGVSANGLTPESTPGTVPPAQATLYRRFHASAPLTPLRSVRDLSRIIDEVIVHLQKLEGAEVRLCLEIEADLPNGATDATIRTVLENARSLGFSSQGFEKE